MKSLLFRTTGTVILKDVDGVAPWGLTAENPNPDYPTGAATLEYADQIAGPWLTDAAGGTALSNIPANSAKEYQVTKPVRFVRLTIAEGVTAIGRGARFVK